MARSLMIEHYEQHLRTSTSRNGRPYAPETTNGYLRCVRQLAAYLDVQNIPGDLTPACDPQVFNAFLRAYLDDHDLNGASFVQRNLRNLFKWLEKETSTTSPFTSEDTDRYVAREHKPQTLAREFIKDLLGSCESTSFTGTRDEAIIRLLLEGMRVGEVADIEPGDVPALTGPILRVTPKKGELRYTDDSGRVRPADSAERCRPECTAAMYGGSTICRREDGRWCSGWRCGGSSATTTSADCGRSPSRCPSSPNGCSAVRRRCASTPLDGLPEAVAAEASLWEQHIVEVLRGVPPQASPGTEPKPEYDPALVSLTRREQAKAAELTAA